MNIPVTPNKTIASKGKMKVKSSQDCNREEIKNATAIHSASAFVFLQKKEQQRNWLTI